MKSVSFFLAPLLVLLAACSTDPKLVCKKYVDNGNKYFDRGKFQEASIMYRRALNKDMRFADAWYHLGLTNLKLAMYGEARKDFSRAMEVDPANQDAVVQLGNIDLMFYLLDPQVNRAALADLKDLGQQLLKKDPSSFDALRFMGYVALLEKDTKTAIQKFEQANRAKPYQPELVLSLVQALFADHQEDRAEHLAKDLMDKQKTYGRIYDLLYVYYLRTDRPGLAEEILKKKIENNPSEGAGLLQLAFHYYTSSQMPAMNSVIAQLTSDPKRFPVGHLQAGDFYVRIHDLDNALQQFEQGRKENPNNKGVYLKRIVEVLGTQGKYDRASQILAGVIKDSPQDPEALAMQATLLLEPGGRQQIKSAIGVLRPLLAKMPANATLHFNLGRAYMLKSEQQNLDQARLEFQEALKVDSKYMPSKLALAELELSRGEHAKAVQAAEEVLNDDPTNLKPRLIRAAGLAGMADYEKAREELNIALKMYPQSTDALFELARLNIREKRYDEAAQGFEKLLETNDPRGFAGLMDTKIAEGHWSEAIRFAEKYVQQSPDRPDYRMALASAYVGAGQFSQAADQYQVLLNKDSSSADLYIRIGEAKLQGKDFQGAMNFFEKAKEFDPHNPAPLVDMAQVYDQTGHPDFARKEYENAIKIQPDNLTALNNLAYLDAEDGVDLDQALVYAQRVQQKLPKDLNVMDTVGLIYVKKNLTDDGLRILHYIVEQKPDSATFHLHLALALYQKGDRPTAKKELQTALRYKPSEKERSKIKELLAKVG
jgi:tetratricopeptide (TPR) repeat protein